MTPLHEQYRPTSWQEVIGQDAALKRLAVLRERRGGLSGRAYWISGGSGTGKTTIARLIASEIADEFSTVELDASGTTAAGISQLERDTRTRGFSGGRCVIVNEAHGLRRDAIRQLLVTLERVPSHVAWIFTTTNDGQDQLFEDCADGHPLLSRCVELPLARRGLAERFAARAREIAQAEGLDGKPEAAYVRLCKDRRNNFRSILTHIESGGML